MTAARWRRGYSASPTTNASIFFGAGACEWRQKPRRRSRTSSRRTSCPGPVVGPAIEHLVLNLPPKERACVLLKDVFDYSLEEIAELVDSTVGGVKAALNRGRSKLASLNERSAAPRAADTPESRDPSPVRRTVQSPGLGWTPRTDQRRRPIARCRSIRRQLRGWRLPRCLFTHARDVAAGTGRGRR